jgi:SAM-dependent methyltransferase
MKTSLYDGYVEKLCSRYLKKTDSVFDCGCGDGQKTKILKSYANSVIGGDFEDRTDPEYKIKFRKITENDYGRKESYDVVTAFDVIEHVEDDKAFILRLLGITKPSGYVIIGTPNRDRFSNKLISFFRGPIKFPRTLGYHFESGGEIRHIREYTKSDFINLLKKIPDAKVAELTAYFFGLYVNSRPVGFRVQNSRACKYAQHLFLVLRKENLTSKAS